MDYTVIGDSVNTVFKLQEFTKTYPNGVLISDITLHAVRAHLNVQEIDVRDTAIGALKIYELISIDQ